MERLSGVRARVGALAAALLVGLLAAAVPFLRADGSLEDVIAVGTVTLVGGAAYLPLVH